MTMHLPVDVVHDEGVKGGIYRVWRELVWQILGFNRVELNATSDAHPSGPAPSYRDRVPERIDANDACESPPGKQDGVRSNVAANIQNCVRPSDLVLRDQDRDCWQDPGPAKVLHRVVGSNDCPKA
jgi:hypothetical protein